ncbi:TlpA family protein disulfide reductase [Halorussus caseinilyticus]|uniref:TlpA family protein disulfide reductase n=1 Tax=Halorussus caseinilyticus TaxID=3034025 RepID=A0ABD5WMJ2_9EURY|nr:TlpA disulfide reductase family protein [Halorussus sp. DT72]
MNRRTLLVALGGLGLTGASAWLLGNDLGSSADLPLRVETMDAQGSEAGEVRLPVENTVTVLDLFATWCSPCKKQMDALDAVHRDFGDEVAMVSVTNERVGGSLSKADIRDWWRTHDGGWTVGLDPDSEIASALGAHGIPYVVVFDADGEVRWQDGGLTDEGVLRKQIADALAER